MLHLYGIPVTDDDARHLVATLIAGRLTGRAFRRSDDLERIERELYAVAITRAERTAILACLEDPPDGALAELRGKLFRERRG